MTFLAAWPQRLARYFRLLVFLVVALAWLTLAGTPAAGPLRRLALAAILRATGTQTMRHGPVVPRGTLIVANHISWLDIVLLARACEAGFVAKREVAGWPLLGALARRAGCLFVARERRGHAGHQADALRAGLAAGRSFVLFAEGTTGPGEHLLPFRTSLFPGDGVLAVQPLAIVYRRADGAPLDPAERRRIAWLGDDELVPHLRALVRTGSCRAELWFGEPFVASDRKQAAGHCRDFIAAKLAELGGKCSTPSG